MDGIGVIDGTLEKGQEGTAPCSQIAKVLVVPDTASEISEISDKADVALRALVTQRDPYETASICPIGVNPEDCSSVNQPHPAIEVE